MVEFISETFVPLAIRNFSKAVHPCFKIIDVLESTPSPLPFSALVRCWGGSIHTSNICLCHQRMKLVLFFFFVNGCCGQLTWEFIYDVILCSGGDLSLHTISFGTIGFRCYCCLCWYVAAYIYTKAWWQYELFYINVIHLLLECSISLFFLSFPPFPIS